MKQLKFMSPIFFRHLFVLFLFLGSNVYAQFPSGKGNAPIRTFYNPNKLAKSVCKNAGSDEERVKAIYAWICYHIKYDAKRYSKSSLKRFSSKRILWRKKALCDEYTQLFIDMCAAVDIKSFMVDGYFKSSYMEVDDTLYNADHVWNMVKVDNKWELVDVTISAGYLTYKPTFLNRIGRILFVPKKYAKLKYVRHLDTSYFLSHPDSFVFNHLPSLPEFQNKSEPLSLFDFQDCRQSNCYPSELQYVNAAAADDWYQLGFKDRFLWHADSAVKFNERNQIVRAIDLRNAAYFTLIDIGYNPKKKRQPLDVNGLKEAVIHLDSSTNTITSARFYVQEEYTQKKAKNQYRHKLAQASIKPIETQNKRTLSYAQKVQSNNNSKAYNYIKANENMNVQKENLLNKELATVKFVTDAETAAAKNKIQLNESIMLNGLDSQVNLLRFISNHTKLISETLLPEAFSKVQDIERFQENISKLTRYSNYLRMNHLDNLDEALANAQIWRIEQNDSLINALKIRNINTQKCDSLDAKNKEHLAILKQLNQIMKQAADANAMLGNNQSKLYEQSLQNTSKGFEMIASSHDNLVEFYIMEAKWSKPLLKNTSKQTNRLKAEVEFEDIRFKLKQKLITEKNDSFKELLTDLSKTNKDFKSKLKLQMKTAAK